MKVWDYIPFTRGVWNYWGRQDRPKHRRRMADLAAQLKEGEGCDSDQATWSDGEATKQSSSTTPAPESE